MQSGLAPRWDTKHITKAHDFGGCLMWSSSSSSECRKPPKNQPSANIEWHWVRPRRPNPTSVVSLAIEFGIFYYCYYFPFSIDHHLSFPFFFFFYFFWWKEDECGIVDRRFWALGLKNYCPIGNHLYPSWWYLTMFSTRSGFCVIWSKRENLE